jgi:hypothetical protein
MAGSRFGCIRWRLPAAVGLALVVSCENGGNSDVCNAVGDAVYAALAAHRVCPSEADCRRRELYYCGGTLSGGVQATVRRVTDRRVMADAEARARRAAAVAPVRRRVSLEFYRDFRDGGPQGTLAWPIRRVRIDPPTP